MPTIKFPKNPNVDTAFVEQDDGTKNRALMIAPQDISTLELPNNPNSTKGYITVDGQKQRVILTADITGGGGGGSALPDQTGHSGEFLTTDGSSASWGIAYSFNSYSATWGTATGSYAIGLGDGSQATGAKAVAIGQDARGNGSMALALGYGARVTANNAIQLNTSGIRTNSDASTFKVGNVYGNFEIMSADGTIPTARFTTDPVADGTYYPTLTISSGTPTRSWSTINALQNKATGSNSLAIEGAATGGFALVIGYYASCKNTSFANCVAVGNGAYSGLDSVSVGNSSTTDGTGCISIGKDAKTQQNYSLAIGYYSKATATSAIQLGNSPNIATPLVNSDANTFKVGNANGNFEIMSADGTIPTARLTKVNTTITIAVADWNGGTTVTKTVSGITATGVVLVSPDPTDQSAYTSAGILCTTQAADSLTFTCSTTPSADIDVNVVCL